VVQLAGGDERYRDDRGGADPAVTAALAAYAGGSGSENAALTALAAARLLVPVVAVPAAELTDADSGRAGHEPRAGQQLAAEKLSEMAVPLIVGRDGRRALPAFTCLAALGRWQLEARPVPVPASGVWQSAAQDGTAVIVDIAGPVPLAVDGARLAALAQGLPVPALHEDPDVWQAVAAAAADLAPGIRVKLGPPDDGLDLTLELAKPAGYAGPVPTGLARQIADAATERLAGRIRRGIALVLPTGGP
jgi:SseB protein N-terminal domain